MRSRRPNRLKTFDYKGKYCYFVTCSTDGRQKLFTDATIVSCVRGEILRTCSQQLFAVRAYAFMEDHLHLLIEGDSSDSDFVKTMTLLRQRTAMAYRRKKGSRLWQDGYYERVLRPTDDSFSFIQYIQENPAKAGLGEERTQFPYVWPTEPASELTRR